MALPSVSFKHWDRVYEIYEQNLNLFAIYEECLLRWNSKINLTSITDHQGIVEKHFYDALVLFLTVEAQNVSRETLRVIDIGTGNGVPGLILKLAQPSWNVTLLDSDRRKCDFLKFVSREMGLPVDVRHVHLDLNKPQGDNFDVVVSRAAFKVVDLLLYSKALLKSEGYLNCMKTSDQRSEMELVDPLKSGQSFEIIQDVEYILASFPKPKRHIYGFKNVSRETNE